MDNKEYQRHFGIITDELQKPSDKHLRAFTQVADIRKFEIEMYWKRATYFWTIIAITFTGYFALASANSFPFKNAFSLLLSSMGSVFTLSWFLVNRGSKYWQENWENHLDLMENGITGPLYKTVLSRPSVEAKKNAPQLASTDKDFIDKHITGPKKISASKINQLVAFYLLGIWLILVMTTITNILKLSFWSESTIEVVLSVGVLIWSAIATSLMFCKSATYTGIQTSEARKRSSNLL
ncbi:TPA: hypothetical protein SM709_001203 [Escherichia coli]|uniref:RipA family octameric membrane protein n=1 Tax=Enterobacteriaceae TaxID=543 RepID=UPI0006A10280|nr:MULTISPECIES: hypothetical protein [Enterobacteriaceae]EFM3381405.1 hypothetical protein [Escherichia coli]EKV0116768.1 hypothetical protein [Escherichia coli]EKV0282792.1 hypothetical protein [Escherichia coli]ELQ6351398.1 hypothetical protein [Escherichia coli]MCC4655805.1 hypothetical protein [Escherichia coli]